METTNSKVLVVNIDDLGLDVGSGEAFLELQKYGSVNSGSVMVPAPWFLQIVELQKTNANLNIGIHLTLTSEWQQYRWRPVSTSKTSSGLIDSDGFFWKNRKLLRENLNIRDAEIELDAQIKMALNSGINLSHIDCHMGIGLIPELVEFYLKLGVKYDLPVLIPRNIEETLLLYKIEDKWVPFYKEIIKKLDANNYHLVDNFKITPCFDSDKALVGYENLLTSLDDGITFLSLHANKPGAIENIDPIKYQVRIDEYNIFRQNFDLNWMRSHGISTCCLSSVRGKL